MIDLTDVSGGHHAEEETPVLEGQAIPHALRHGAILGALGQLRPGASMILAVDHDPQPLLRQVRDTFDTEITWDYDSRDAGDVRVRFTRTSA